MHGLQRKRDVIICMENPTNHGNGFLYTLWTVVFVFCEKFKGPCGFTFSETFLINYGVNLMTATYS